MSLSVTKRFYNDFQSQFPRLYQEKLWRADKKIIVPDSRLSGLSNCVPQNGVNPIIQVQNNHEATQMFIKNQAQNASAGQKFVEKQEVKRLSDLCEDGNTEAVLGMLQDLKKNEKTKETEASVCRSPEAEFSSGKEVQGVHQEFKKSLIEKVSMSTSFDQVGEWIETMLPRLKDFHQKDQANQITELTRQNDILKKAYRKQMQREKTMKERLDGLDLVSQENEALKRQVMMLALNLEHSQKNQFNEDPFRNFHIY